MRAFKKFVGWGAETFSDRSKMQTPCNMAVKDTNPWFSMEKVWMSPHLMVQKRENSVMKPSLNYYKYKVQWKFCKLLRLVSLMCLCLFILFEWFLGSFCRNLSELKYICNMNNMKWIIWFCPRMVNVFFNYLSHIANF